ncbi:MAG: carboxylesterase, partial [Gammaproteobacteria bacterium]|nr:carboxylesterase [Gammaproteobacteria bacterium]
AHGRYDEVLPLRLGLDSRTRLEAAGCHVEWREYEMGHQVCGPELADISVFMQKVSGAMTGTG